MSYVPVAIFNQKIKLQHLWGIVVIAGVFIFVNTHPIRPHDFWWHIAIGREIIQSGIIPETDIYSYTAFGENYPAYSVYWVMEVTLYTIYQLGGAALVVFFQSLVITSAYIFIFLTGLHITDDWRFSAVGTMFAAALGLYSWNVRPQAITLLLCALFMFLVQKLESSNNRWWAVLFPVGMVIWVNSHGSFPLGLFIIGLWLGKSVWDVVYTKRDSSDPHPFKQPFIASLTLSVSVLACLINPSGFGIIQYLQDLHGNEAVQNLVVEWAPPTFDTFGGTLFLGALLLAALILALSPKPLNLFQLCTFVVIAILGLQTARGIVYFGLVIGPAVAEHSHATWKSIREALQPRTKNAESVIINWVIFGIVISMCFFSLPWFKELLPLPQLKAGLISQETPIGATDHLLETTPPGQLFHAMSFGSYLIWAASPEYRVFVDGRIELYSNDVWRDYLEISNAGESWEERLQEYGIHTLMLSRVEQPNLVAAVRNSKQWEQVFEDGAATIFVSK